MKKDKTNKTRKEKILSLITVIIVVLLFIGAALQICSRHGVFTSKVKSPEKEKKSEIKMPDTFESYQLGTPYVIGNNKDAEYDLTAEKCKVEEISSNGIRLSDVYYLTDTENGIDQIRFRYGIDNDLTQVNLLVRGMISFEDEAGNSMLGLHNALTDNYKDEYRSQIVTLNLAGTQYADAHGRCFRLVFDVDTTDFKAEYYICVPNKDGTFAERTDFSKGLDAPYVMNDEAGKTYENASSVKCEKEEIFNTGLTVSDVYYITDTQNGIEQLRLRYAIKDKASDVNLAVKGIVSVYDEDGEEMFGIFNTVTDNFEGYRTQTVNIDFGESGYSGNGSKTIEVEMSVDGTENSARYRITVPVVVTEAE